MSFTTSPFFLFVISFIKVVNDAVTTEFSRIILGLEFLNYTPFEIFSESARMLGVTTARQVTAGLPLLRGVSRRSMSAAALPQPITEPDVKVKWLFY